MPAKTTIFNFRGVAKHNFPLGPRNTLLFSPHGRFVLVAGFGNLAGQMDIFDVDKDYTKITTVEAANASVCDWSPDGHYILTATTSPRLRVDNGIRLWHVSGNLMYNEDMHELYDVFWRPQSHPAEPPADPLKNPPAPHPSAPAYLSTRKVPAKPAGAYRPPGARGQGTPLAFKREDEGGTGLTPSNGDSGSGTGNGPSHRARRRDVPGAEATEYLPPGAAPGGGVVLPGSDQEKLSKSATKNKKKREAKKKEGDDAAAAAAAAAPGAPTGTPTAPKASRKAQPNGKPNGKPAAEPAAAPEPAPAAAAAAEDANPTGQDKKIRGLLKKMRAIDELKMRLAGGEKLEDTQMKKIETEEGVRKELEASGYTG